MSLIGGHSTSPLLGDIQLVPYWETFNLSLIGGYSTCPLLGDIQLVPYWGHSTNPLLGDIQLVPYWGTFNLSLVGGYSTSPLLGDIQLVPYWGTFTYSLFDEYLTFTEPVLIKRYQILSLPGMFNMNEKLHQNISQDYEFFFFKFHCVIQHQIQV